MKGYKGFSKGLVCRGKQYAENTVFEEDDAKICKSGMHFCENPFNEYKLAGFKAHKVDGKTIKPDTFYSLKNGKFIAVK